MAVGALFYGARKRNARLVTAALLMGLGTLVVGVLKSLSHHSCPWDLVEYGGKAVLPLFSSAPADSGPPLLPRRPCVQRLYGDGSVLCLLARASASRPSFVAFGVVLGLAMGFGQVMRGAHFSLTTCGLGGGSGFPGSGLRPRFCWFAKE